MCYRCRRGDVPAETELRFEIGNPSLGLALVMGWEGRPHKMSLYAICPLDGAKMDSGSEKQTRAGRVLLDPGKRQRRAGHDLIDSVDCEMERYHCARRPGHFVEVEWHWSKDEEGVSTWQPSERLAADLAAQEANQPKGVK